MTDVMFDEVSRCRQEITRLSRERDEVLEEHAAHIYRLREEIMQQENEMYLLRQQMDALLEALAALMDEQSGPPLIRRQGQWQAAMDKARAAIKAVEGEKT